MTETITAERTDLELLDEAIRRLEADTADKSPDWRHVATSLALLELVRALRERVDSIYDTVGSVTIAQAVARENISGLAELVAFLRVSGWVR